MPQYKILFVDDSSSILKALRRVFALEDYGIFCATSAAEALTVLSRDDIDVVVSDENMPGISGTELLVQVREKYPDVVRMMLTGETDIEIAKGAINEGAITRFFTKPWEDWELLIGIQQALRVKELEQENKHLKSSISKQGQLLQELERAHPGITSKRLTEDGAFIID